MAAKDSVCLPSPGPGGQGNKDRSWHKSFSQEREGALCSVPDKVTPTSRELEQQTSDTSF